MTAVATTCITGRRLGEFWLSSDAVIPTFSREPRMASIIEQIPPEELDTFNSLGYTIGGMMVFPGTGSTAR